MALVLAALLFAAAPVLALDPPALTGRVNDLAGMMSPEARARVEAVLADLERTDTTQVAVLTVPSLEGDSIEEFSLRVAEKWGLGQKGRDNGALVLVAKADRKMRIEVGYGLEGRLTDLLAGRIIDNVMAPRFKAGDFDGGFIAAAEAVAGAARGEFKAESKRRRSSGGGGLGFFALLVVFGALSAMSRLGGMARPVSRARRAGMGTGPFIIFPGGFGGGGGGGFGGGGFSGGGGGFGGGGSSGGW
ncbi:MAG: TPM domain-containing protein [Thermodesulfobacteriota bacterium]